MNWETDALGCLLKKNRREKAHLIPLAKQSAPHWTKHINHSTLPLDASMTHVQCDSFDSIVVNKYAHFHHLISHISLCSCTQRLPYQARRWQQLLALCTIITTLLEKKPYIYCRSLEETLKENIFRHDPDQRILYLHKLWLRQQNTWILNK